MIEDPTTVTDPDNTVLEGRDLVKEFIQGGVTLQVLRGASIKVRAGERIAIVGASGSGKTTLLQLLGGLDLPTRGTV
jgi:lipoprotein-releasing system ATP-binding protein